MTITSRASATIKEAPAKYEWKRFDSVNSDKAFTASSAIQQMIETILMFTDIFIPLRPEPVCTRSERGQDTPTDVLNGHGGSRNRRSDIALANGLGWGSAWTGSYTSTAKVSARICSARSTNFLRRDKSRFEVVARLSGTERCYGAGGEEMAPSSLHLTDGVPRYPSRTT